MNVAILTALVVLIIIDLPVVFAFGLTAIAGVLASGELPLSVIPQRIFVGLDSFPLLAAPLFMLAGEIMSGGAMSDRLIRFATALFGHLRGSLAMICVIATTLFSCASGSGAADTAAVGSILIPAMIKRGYKAGFATALQASAGCLGPIIPPSIAMVILRMGRRRLGWRAVSRRRDTRPRWHNAIRRVQHFGRLAVERVPAPLADVSGDDRGAVPDYLRAADHFVAAQILR